MARTVIVGGVAGGASAAARLRRRDETAEIVVLERGEYVSFANCGLPYYVGGAIAEREALLVSTPDKLRAELAIDVRTRHEVLRIDRAAKQVLVRDLLAGQDYSLPYDKLILSPGAQPVVPNVPGVGLPGVYSLRTLPDADAIKAMIDAGHVRRAVVVGGGFIGLEMAENLVARGVRVTLVEMLGQVMAPLDLDMAALVHRHLRDRGVLLALGSSLKAIEAAPEGGLVVQAGADQKHQADMVVLAIGVRPESTLAAQAGLDLGPRGHIVVNEHLQTSDPDVYALGDAIQVLNPVTGAPCAVPLAGPANRQARIAADHITGGDARYRGTWGTSIVKVFDLTVATVGSNARGLQGAGLPYLTTITHSQDHVAYYPGATLQSIKLLYRPDDGRLLGAQVVGYNAVDRTIDTLATALQAGMTVYDLEHLELAYAPPYGAAKDPVNIAGYVAANRLRGDSHVVEWSELVALREAGLGVVDVREEVEFAVGHMEGAVHIPLGQLRARYAELDPARQWAVYCKVGRRAYLAERILRQHGYDVVNVSGGFTTYEVAMEKQSSDLDGGNTGAAGTSAAPWTDAVPQPQVQAAVMVDACGLQCPGPIMAVYKAMEGLQPGQILRATATDPGFARDVAAWAERTGNTLVDLQRYDHRIEAFLRKGLVVPGAPRPAAHPSEPTAKTMVVFSADLDRALASFVIANGALAMGQKVTMFFTFWGLNILRRQQAGQVSKTLIERMFGWLMPKGPGALTLSRLNMGGLGTLMMKQVMQSKRIDSLPALMQSAMDNGARLIACQMTMEMMGIKPEELIDGVEIGGVATYINETDRANATLFI